MDAVVAFGSYLTARERIGDIDLAVRLRRRKQSNRDHEALRQASVARMPPGPDLYGAWTQEWPEQEVLVAIKAKNRFLELRVLTELDESQPQVGGRISQHVLLGHWSPPRGEDQ